MIATTTETHTMTMRVFIAPCSEPTNGKWHDLEDYSDLAELEVAAREAIVKTPANNFAEELDCPDYEGFGSFFTGSYYVSVADAWKVYEWAQDAESRGMGFEVAMAYASNQYCNASNLPDVKTMEDEFNGTWDTFQDFAENLLDDCGTLDKIPEELRGYFDTTAYARDLQHSYNVLSLDSGVAVFSA